MYVENPNCIVQTQKKYTSRPGPPYPANECCGEVKMGNDGKGYISLGNKNGVCTWKLLNKSSPKKRVASPKKVVFEKPVVQSPKKQVLASPKKVAASPIKIASPKKLAMDSCMALKVVELKDILSKANVAGRSKLTNKDLMCREIVRLGL